LRTAITDLRDAWKRPGAPRIPDNVQKALDELDNKMSAIEKTPAGRGGGGGEYVPPPVSQRISTLLNSIDGYAFAPTAEQLAEIPRLRVAMTDVNAKIKPLIEVDLPNLNKLMSDAGVPYISLPDEPAGAGARRGR
jgi:hypothetical protein